MEVGIKASIKNIDEILVKMSADHPGDIIADILHWCEAQGEDFENLLRIGREYYNDERNAIDDVSEGC